jgi:rhodanese-related sulfurtransferase
VGQELEKMGFSKVYILLGGWKGWEGKEYPTVPKELS